MFPQWLADHINELRKRALADAGFEEWTGGGYRPDATAWAISLALSAADPENDLLEPSRSRLAAGQLKDGRVSLSPDAAEAFWPTPLAVLAWQGSPAHHKAQTRAVHFHRSGAPGSLRSGGARRGTFWKSQDWAVFYTKTVSHLST